MTEERKASLHETSILLCEAYNTLLEKNQIAFPLTDESISKLDSVIKTVYSFYYEIERFPTPQDKAAAFFCFLIKDHPFIDGNKRMATLWVEVFAKANALSIYPHVRLDELAVSVENVPNASLDKVIPVVKEILFD